MGWVIGGWRIFEEGTVHQALKKCVNVLLESGMRIEADLLTEKKPIEYGRGVFEALNEYEKKHGVDDLLEILIKGLKVKCFRDEELQIQIGVILRLPSDSQEHMELFKDMVTAWVEENPMTYCERYFRLPKITEDIADRYLDNPLEQTLKKTFGFHFNYKITITSSRETPKLEELRKKLYRALR